MSVEKFDSGNQDNFNQYGNQYGNLPVPNSTGALVLGILSLVFCGLIGIILGVIAIVLSNQGEKVFLANPQNFTEASYKNLKAGKTCGIIGICLGAAILLFVVIYFLVVGSLVFSSLR